MAKSENIKVYISIVLVLILAWLIGAHFMKSHAIPQSPRPIQEPLIFDLNQAEKSNYDKLGQKAEEIMFKREPFFEIAVTRPSKQPKLMGIIWDQDKPAALFDDRVLFVGGEISGYKIVDIKKDSATLSDGEQNIEVSIGEHLPQILQGKK